MGGRKANITITNSVGRLSSTEIEQLKNADREFQAKHDSRNDLEAYVHSIEGTLSGPTGNFKRAQKIQVEQELAKALELLESQDATADDYRRCSLRLKRAVQKGLSGGR